MTEAAIMLLHFRHSGAEALHPFCFFSIDDINEALMEFLQSTGKV